MKHVALQTCPHGKPYSEYCWHCNQPSVAASEVEAAEPTAGAVGVRSSAVVRPPSSGGQPERETGGQLRIRPPSAGQAEGESDGDQPSGAEERTCANCKKQRHCVACGLCTHNPHVADYWERK